MILVPIELLNGQKLSIMIKPKNMSCGCIDGPTEYSLMPCMQRHMLVMPLVIRQQGPLSIRKVFRLDRAPEGADDDKYPAQPGMARRYDPIQR